MIGKTSESKIFWTIRGIVAQQSLQVSCLSDMHSRFYEYSKLKKWMRELCTFSQIQSHIYIHTQQNTHTTSKHTHTLTNKHYTHNIHIHLVD